MVIPLRYWCVLVLCALCLSSGTAGAQTPARAVAAGVPPVAHDGEVVPEGEADAIAQLTKTTLDAMRKAGATERGQHPKHHGFVVAKFTVLENIPGDLKVGLFREPRSYTAVIRFSSTRQRDDSVPDTHGMAIKLFGVKGEKVLQGEKETDTQDFVLLDHPLFFARNVSALLKADELERALIQGRASAQSLKDVIPAQIAELALQTFSETLPREAMIIKLRRKLIPSPLAPQYFSTTPYKFGKIAVKYSAKPEADGTPSQTMVEGEDGLRKAMVAQLTTRKQAATFGFYIQRQGKGMPIEDPTVEWMSPWEKVATIVIDAQDFDFPERTIWGNALSYTPWHALKEHRPLGGINRARKIVYPASSELRHEKLPPATEPTEAEIPIRK